MKARELREGDRLLDVDGSVIYIITKLFCDWNAGEAGAEVRYRDGGDADRVFDLDAEVPHVRP